MILGVALIILGPKRIPEVARSLGRGLAEFRRATSGISEEFQSAQASLEEEYRKASAEALAATRPQPAAKPPQSPAPAPAPEATEDPAGAGANNPKAEPPRE